MPQRPIQDAAVTEGGYGKIQPRDAAKPHSPISLIPLWLSPVKRPHPRRCSKIGEDDSDPPENRGVMWPQQRCVAAHRSCPPHEGSLSSSFIPAGRLGAAPSGGADGRQTDP